MERSSNSSADFEIPARSLSFRFCSRVVSSCIRLSPLVAGSTPTRLRTPPTVTRGGEWSFPGRSMLGPRAFCFPALPLTPLCLYCISYRPYDDSLPGFAPSLKTMTASFGGDPIAAGKAFCGVSLGSPYFLGHSADALPHASFGRMSLRLMARLLV